MKLYILYWENGYGEPISSPPIDNLKEFTVKTVSRALREEFFLVTGAISMLDIENFLKDCKEYQPGEGEPPTLFIEREHDNDPKSPYYELTIEPTTSFTGSLTINFSRTADIDEIQWFLRSLDKHIGYIQEENMEDEDHITHFIKNIETEVKAKYENP